MKPLDDARLDEIHHRATLSEYGTRQAADVGMLLAEVRRLKTDRDAWKRRAEQHGCNVTDGDPDCG